jgi:hypothetical protein
MVKIANRSGEESRVPMAELTNEYTITKSAPTTIAKGICPGPIVSRKSD